MTAFTVDMPDHAARSLELLVVLRRTFHTLPKQVQQDAARLGFALAEGAERFFDAQLLETGIGHQGHRDTGASENEESLTTGDDAQGQPLDLAGVGDEGQPLLDQRHASGVAGDGVLDAVIDEHGHGLAPSRSGEAE